MTKMEQDIYKVCPIYESEHFLLRLVRREDAAELLACYADPQARQCFNDDNCTYGYGQETLEEMRETIRMWLQEYDQGCFIRFAILEKKGNTVVGTVEMFGGERGVLRMDLRPEYEEEDLLAELLNIAERFFVDFDCAAIVTKSFAASPQRTRALERHGYAPYPISDGWNWEGYYGKTRPVAP